MTWLFCSLHVNISRTSRQEVRLACKEGGRTLDSQWNPWPSSCFGAPGRRSHYWRLPDSGPLSWCCKMVSKSYSWEEGGLLSSRRPCLPTLAQVKWTKLQMCDSGGEGRLCRQNCMFIHVPAVLGQQDVIHFFWYLFYYLFYYLLCFSVIWSLLASVHRD